MFGLLLLVNFENEYKSRCHSPKASIEAAGT